MGLRHELMPRYSVEARYPLDPRLVMGSRHQMLDESTPDGLSVLILDDFDGRTVVSVSLEADSYAEALEEGLDEAREGLWHLLGEFPPTPIELYIFDVTNTIRTLTFKEVL